MVQAAKLEQPITPTQLQPSPLYPSSPANSANFGAISKATVEPSTSTPIPTSVSSASKNDPSVSLLQQSLLERKPAASDVPQMGDRQIVSSVIPLPASNTPTIQREEVPHVDEKNSTPTQPPRSDGSGSPEIQPVSEIEVLQTETVLSDQLIQDTSSSEFDASQGQVVQHKILETQLEQSIQARSFAEEHKSLSQTIQRSRILEPQSSDKIPESVEPEQVSVVAEQPPKQQLLQRSLQLEESFSSEISAQPTETNHFESSIQQTTSIGSESSPLPESSSIQRTESFEAKSPASIHLNQPSISFTSEQSLRLDQISPELRELQPSIHLIQPKDAGQDNFLRETVATSAQAIQQTETFQLEAENHRQSDLAETQQPAVQPIIESSQSTPIADTNGKQSTSTQTSDTAEVSPVIWRSIDNGNYAESTVKSPSQAQIDIVQLTAFSSQSTQQVEAQPPEIQPSSQVQTGIEKISLVQTEHLNQVSDISNKQLVQQQTDNSNQSTSMHTPPQSIESIAEPIEKKDRGQDSVHKSSQTHPLLIQPSLLPHSIEIQRQPSPAGELFMIGSSPAKSDTEDGVKQNALRSQLPKPIIQRFGRLYRWLKGEPANSVAQRQLEPQLPIQDLDPRSKFSASTTHTTHDINSISLSSQSNLQEFNQSIEANQLVDHQILQRTEINQSSISEIGNDFTSEEISTDKNIFQPGEIVNRSPVEQISSQQVEFTVQQKSINLPNEATSGIQSAKLKTQIISSEAKLATPAIQLTLPAIQPTFHSANSSELNHNSGNTVEGQAVIHNPPSVSFKPSQVTTQHIFKSAIQGFDLDEKESYLEETDSGKTSQSTTQIKAFSVAHQEPIVSCHDKEVSKSLTKDDPPFKRDNVSQNTLQLSAEVAARSSETAIVTSPVTPELTDQSSNYHFPSVVSSEPIDSQNSGSAQIISLSAESSNLTSQHTRQQAETSSVLTTNPTETSPLADLVHISAKSGSTGSPTSTELKQSSFSSATFSSAQSQSSLLQRSPDSPSSNSTITTDISESLHNSNQLSLAQTSSLPEKSTNVSPSSAELKQTTSSSATSSSEQAQLPPLQRSPDSPSSNPVITDTSESLHNPNQLSLAQTSSLSENSIDVSTFNTELKQSLFNSATSSSEQSQSSLLQRSPDSSSSNPVITDTSESLHNSNQLSLAQTSSLPKNSTDISLAKNELKQPTSSSATSSSEQAQLPPLQRSPDSPSSNSTITTDISESLHNSNQLSLAQTSSLSENPTDVFPSSAELKQPTSSSATSSSEQAQLPPLQRSPDSSSSNSTITTDISESLHNSNQLDLAQTSSLSEKSTDVSPSSTELEQSLFNSATFSSAQSQSSLLQRSPDSSSSNPIITTTDTSESLHNSNQLSLAQTSSLPKNSTDISLAKNELKQPTSSSATSSSEQAQLSSLQRSPDSSSSNSTITTDISESLHNSNQLDLAQTSSLSEKSTDVSPSSTELKQPTSSSATSSSEQAQLPPLQRSPDSPSSNSTITTDISESLHNSNQLSSAQTSSLFENSIDVSTFNTELKQSLFNSATSSSEQSQSSLLQRSPDSSSSNSTITTDISESLHNSNQLDLAQTSSLSEKSTDVSPSSAELKQPTSSSATSSSEQAQLPPLQRSPDSSSNPTVTTADTSKLPHDSNQLSLAQASSLPEKSTDVSPSSTELESSPFNSATSSSEQFQSPLLQRSPDSSSSNLTTTTADTSESTHDSNQLSLAQSSPLSENSTDISPSNTELEQSLFNSATSSSEQSQSSLLQRSPDSSSNPTVTTADTSKLPHDSNQLSLAQTSSSSENSADISPSSTELEQSLFNSATSSSAQSQSSLLQRSPDSSSSNPVITDTSESLHNPNQLSLAQTSSLPEKSTDGSPSNTELKRPTSSSATSSSEQSQSSLLQRSPDSPSSNSTITTDISESLHNSNQLSSAQTNSLFENQTGNNITDITVAQLTTDNTFERISDKKTSKTSSLVSPNLQNSIIARSPHVVQSDIRSLIQKSELQQSKLQQSRLPHIYHDSSTIHNKEYDLKPQSELPKLNIANLNTSDITNDQSIAQPSQHLALGIQQQSQQPKIYAIQPTTQISTQQVETQLEPSVEKFDMMSRSQIDKSKISSLVQQSSQAKTQINPASVNSSIPIIQSKTLLPIQPTTPLQLTLKPPSELQPELQTERHIKSIEDHNYPLEAKSQILSAVQRSPSTLAENTTSHLPSSPELNPPPLQVRDRPSSMSASPDHPPPDSPSDVERSISSKQLDLSTASLLPPGTTSTVKGPRSMKFLEQPAETKSLMEESLKQQAQIKSITSSRKGKATERIRATELEAVNAMPVKAEVVKQTEEKSQETDYIEVLAREVYLLLRQRIEIDRERTGSYYSGRF
jgi:hypothetical protein